MVRFSAAEVSMQIWGSLVFFLGGGFGWFDGFPAGVSGVRAAGAGPEGLGFRVFWARQGLLAVRGLFGAERMALGRP